MERIRAYEWRGVRAALAFAREGGIALHFFRWAHPRFGAGEYCHVLCADRERLIAFGRPLGFDARHLQPPKQRDVWHYDAFGERTRRLRALASGLPQPLPA